MRNIRRILLILIPFAILLFIEFVLRVAGYPSGLFLFALKGKRGLFPPSSSIPQNWGPVPFTVKTNSFGFRGKEFEFRKTSGVLRIAAVGDSVTIGFFVENEDTYPAILETKLASRRRVEVLNAAFGGGSIDKELVLLKEVLVHLKPDIVLLTFVTNDIWDIRNVSRREIVSLQMKEPKSTRFVKWFLTKTAVGEAAFDMYMRTQSKQYRGAERKTASKHTNNRYEFSGSRNFLENARKFDDTFRNVDGLVLREPFDLRTMELIENYLIALNEFKRVCEANRIRLVFIYFPAYSQVYGDHPSMKIRDLLASHSLQQHVPFLDLTETMRLKGKDRVLHLAPVDFHLNPAGNEVMAEAIAQFLASQQLL